MNVGDARVGDFVVVAVLVREVSAVADRPVRDTDCVSDASTVVVGVVVAVRESVTVDNGVDVRDTVGECRVMVSVTMLEAVFDADVSTVDDRLDVTFGENVLYVNDAVCVDVGAFDSVALTVETAESDNVGVSRLFVRVSFCEPVVTETEGVAVELLEGDLPERDDERELTKVELMEKVT